MKLDLGCGYKKLDGFIGVDIVDAPDIVKSDILSYLKTLKDNKIEKVRMYHSLEHIPKKEYLEVMKNLFRVCKNGAIIEIGVPYYNNPVNLANPYHNISFNEHSFRFFCREKNDRYNVLKKEDWVVDYSFGLWGSANEQKLPGYVRIKKIDFEYTDEFKNKPQEEKYKARKNNKNIIKNMNIVLEVEKE